MATPRPILQHLSWDSDFLGFPVGCIQAKTITPDELQATLVAARKSNIRLLYLVVAPDDADTIAVAQKAGAWLADRKVTFVMPLNAAHSIIETTGIITNTTVYTPQLESLAWQSAEYSRFRLDPHLEPTVYKRMYSLWLHNSLSGDIAQKVLVWHNTEGQELGLLTLGEKKGRADIGLLAVDITARGQRVGHQLVAAAVAQSNILGYTELQVVTQFDNKPACSFYRKCGFKLIQEEYIYHLWF